MEIKREAFRAFVPLLPPSVNDLYFYTPTGPRDKTPTKTFKSKASKALMKSIAFDAEPLDSNTPYRLEIRFYLPALYNKSWPEKAKTRFKRRDTSNLIKLIEDVVSKSLGVDDSAFVEIFAQKFDGPTTIGETGLVVILSELGPHEPGA